jgi:endonuclease YncB( thermonuclease family)
MKTPFLAFAFCIVAVPAQAFTARVTVVHDGDTIHVTTLSGADIKVRLAEMDAPELDQPFGQRARRALCDLICGKTVEIDDWGLDRYGRTVGLIHAPFDVSEEMVREGMAWVYERYNLDAALPGIEEQARAGRVGLWSDPQPTPPREWRQLR